MYQPSSLDLTYDYAFKVLIMGEPNVGSRSLVYRFVQNNFPLPSMNPLMYQDANFRTRYFDTDGRRIKMRIDDNRESTGIGSYNAYIFVFDITNRQSFDSLSRYLQAITVNTPENVIKLIIGNKLDLTTTRQVSYAEAEAFSHSHNSSYVETSALTGTNVDDAFVFVARAILSQMASSLPAPPQPAVPIRVGLVGQPAPQPASKGPGCVIS